ncbi:hypothetical protein D3C71_1588490 [compost metagenome]
MVVIGGWRQVQQLLQQPVNGGCVKQIHAAHHMGDALQRVIQHHGEMIARGGVGARQHHIAPQRRQSFDFPGLPVAALAPEQLAVQGADRLFHVEPPGVLPARCQKFGPFRLRPLPIYCRVKRRAVGIARPEPSLCLKGPDNGFRLTPA